MSLRNADQPGSHFVRLWRIRNFMPCLPLYMLGLRQAGVMGFNERFQKIIA